MEINFDEIVRLIHPDNSNLDNVSEKMLDVLRNRNNPNELYRFAIQWGLVVPDVSTYEPQVTDEDTTSETTANEVPTQGDEEAIPVSREPIVTEINGATISVDPLRSPFPEGVEPEWISPQSIRQEHEAMEREAAEQGQTFIREQIQMVLENMGWEQIALRNGWTPPEGWESPENRESNQTQPEQPEQPERVRGTCNSGRPNRESPTDNRSTRNFPTNSGWRLPAEERRQPQRPEPRNLGDDRDDRNNRNERTGFFTRIFR